MKTKTRGFLLVDIDFENSTNPAPSSGISAATLIGRLAADFVQSALCVQSLDPRLNRAVFQKRFGEKNITNIYIYINK